MGTLIDAAGGVVIPLGALGAVFDVASDGVSLVDNCAGGAEATRMVRNVLRAVAGTAWGEGILVDVAGVVSDVA